MSMPKIYHDSISYRLNAKGVVYTPALRELFDYAYSVG